MLLLSLALVSDALAEASRSDMCDSISWCSGSVGGATGQKQVGVMFYTRADFLNELLCAIERLLKAPELGGME